MDITTSLAAQSYANARPATKPGEASATGSFMTAIGDFASTLQGADAAARSAMTGTGDTQSLVEALVTSELAVETAVTLRDKVVQAYQEILRMPV